MVNNTFMGPLNSAVGEEPSLFITAQYVAYGVSVMDISYAKYFVHKYEEKWPEEPPRTTYDTQVDYLVNKQRKTLRHFKSYMDKEDKRAS